MIQSGQGTAPFVIDRAVSDADFAGIERLQTEIWSQATSVPGPLLRVFEEIGGLVLLARAENHDVVGLSTSLPGKGRDDAAWLWSHMAGVHPMWRRSGVGTALKLEQFRRAREKGFRVVTWTFDPLEAANARFNLHRLGALARTYLEDAYGAMDDPLNRGLPTDRLVAEVWLDEPFPKSAAIEPDHVFVRAVATPGAPLLPVLDEAWAASGTQSGRVEPPCPLVGLPAPLRAAIEVPLDFRSIRRSAAAAARHWRLIVRRAFCQAFSEGWVATDFLSDESHGVGRYLLAPIEGQHED